MLIDWFTVGAQVINFLILVWLMKRFLYKPIVVALDTREKLIATQIADAKKKQDDAQKQSDEFTAKNEDIDKQRATLLNQATADAAKERERLLDEAKKAATALALKRQESMQGDELHLRQSIRMKTQHEVFAIAKKALVDLSGMTLEERIVGVFIARLQALAQDEKSHLASALKSAKEPIVVTTGFDLSASQNAAIESAVKNLLGTGRKIQFKTAPDLIGGIELMSNGQKVAWSISDFLGSLEKTVLDMPQDKKTVVHSP